jgi:hypothetical protein
VVELVVLRLEERQRLPAVAVHSKSGATLVLIDFHPRDGELFLQVSIDPVQRC